MGRYTSPTANTGPPANCGQPQLGIRTGVSNVCFEQVFRTSVPNGCSERVFRTFVLGPLEAVTIGQQMVKFTIIRGLDKILFSWSTQRPVRAGKASTGRLSRNYTIGSATVANIGRCSIGSTGHCVRPSDRRPVSAPVVGSTERAQYRGGHQGPQAAQTGHPRPALAAYLGAPCSGPANTGRTFVDTIPQPMHTGAATELWGHQNQADGHTRTGAITTSPPWPP